MLTYHLVLYALAEDKNMIGKTGPDHYEIRIQGHLEGRWAARFDGLSITLADSGETLLAGPVADQAALHALLRKVRDLGVPLLSVNRVEPGHTDVPDSQ